MLCCVCKRSDWGDNSLKFNVELSVTEQDFRRYDRLYFEHGKYELHFIIWAAIAQSV